MVKCGARCILPPVLRLGFLDLAPGRFVGLLVSRRGAPSRPPRTCCVAFVRKQAGESCWVAQRNAPVVPRPHQSGRACALARKSAAVVTRPQQQQPQQLQSHIESSSPSSPLGQNLSEEQRAAVETQEDCVRVVAGPGSGKTLVLTHRIAHLITKGGINPSSILCLTFTNKAKGELRQRLLKLLGKDALKLTIGTFHSVCARILREYAIMEDVGFDKDFVIYDDQDSERVVKRILVELAERSEIVSKPSRGQNLSQSGKDDSDSRDQKEKQKQKVVISAQTVQAISRGIAELKDFELRNFVAKQTKHAEPLKMPQGLRSFRPQFDRYQRTLREANAADFDDLIYQTVRLFYRRPELRKGCQQRWSYVLADEFQDTDWAQFVFLRLLCETNKNLFVVGDVDQAIYGWRGADYKHMEDLQKHFRNVATFELRRNYRSSQSILHMAAEVISRANRGYGSLKPLKLESMGPRGAPVMYSQCLDSNCEASYVVKSIRRLVDQEKAASFGSCGILFRTRAQGHVFEASCVANRIPYTVGGSATLLSRKEVKDLRSYLQLVWNPDDALALANVVNTPPRGLGQTTLNKIGDWASNLVLPLPRALRKISSEEVSHKELGITTRARKSLLQFCQLLEDLQKQSESEPVSELIQEIFNRTQMLEYYKRSDEANSSERVTHLRLFQDLAKSTELENGCGRPALGGFLESIALNSDIHEGIAEPADAVRLSTLHAAKGLEFDYVFIVGAEEGILPLGNSDLEEERRLFYVGVTRARKELYITSRLRVMVPGEGFRNGRASQFLTSSLKNVYMSRKALYSQSGEYVEDEALI